MFSKTCNSSPADATGKSPERRNGLGANLLTEDERLKLATIRRNRNQGWMPTFWETDFLLEMVEKLSR